VRRLVFALVTVLALRDARVLVEEELEGTPGGVRSLVPVVAREEVRSCEAALSSGGKRSVR
jgi:hypothetical protein